MAVTNARQTALAATADQATADATMTGFFTECWYAAAWTDEVGIKPFGLTICDQPIVLLRETSGQVAAVSGLCPHRFASLSAGRFADDKLQCPYHGLEFSFDGRCVGNPHGPIPNVLRLRIFPIIDRYSVLWIWMGDVGKANPTLIPDMSPLSSSDYRTVRGRLKTRANYELITDNLMDLTHVGFVHAGSIGSDAVQRGQHEVIQSGTTVFSNRWCPDAAAPSVWAKLFGNYAGNVDHWLNMRWDAPSTMWLDVGVTPTGLSRDEGITVFGAHLLTPETSASTHYLFAGARDFGLYSDELDAGLKASLEAAFVDEDRPLLEQIERNMGGRLFADMRPLILPFDEGAIRARRLRQEMQTGHKKQLPSIAEWQGRLVPR